MLGLQISNFVIYQSCTSQSGPMGLRFSDLVFFFQFRTSSMRPYRALDFPLCNLTNSHTLNQAPWGIGLLTLWLDSAIENKL